MFNIKDYFDKFKKISQGSSDKKQTIRTVLKKYCKIELDDSNIKINEFDFSLNISPIFKNEINMKKDLIEKHLSSEGVFLKIKL